MIVNKWNEYHNIVSTIELTIVFQYNLIYVIIYGI